MQRITDAFTNMHPVPDINLWQMGYIHRQKVRSPRATSQFLSFLIFTDAWIVVHMKKQNSYNIGIDT